MGLYTYIKSICSTNNPQLGIILKRPRINPYGFLILAEGSYKGCFISTYNR